MEKLNGLKDNLDKLQTGDIILFGGSQFWFSRLVRWWTGSQFSHIGIVLRDPTYIKPDLKGLYLWESGIEYFNDSEDKVRKLGVQITDLNELLKIGYDGYLVYRKLHANIPDFESKIKAIHEVIYNRPYDINLYDLLEANSSVKKVEKQQKLYKGWFANWTRPNHHRNDTYFCSALVGFIYTELGLLPDYTQWTECTPKFFSSEENPSMKLLGGNYLDVDKLLYKNPKLK